MSTRAGLVAVIVAFVAGLLTASVLPRALLAPAHPPGTAHGAPQDAALAAALDRTSATQPAAQPPPAPAERTIRWRVSSAFGTHLPALGENAVEVARRIEAASAGRLHLTVDDPDEVVPAFAIVEAVGRGKIAAGYTWLGYEEGRLPASVLFGAVPFGMTPWEYTAWWHGGGGRALAQAIYRPLGIE